MVLRILENIFKAILHRKIQDITIVKLNLLSDISSAFPLMQRGTNVVNEKTVNF